MVREPGRPCPGNLLPVLDLETSRGLDQQDVTLWARRWTAEVRRLTGVTPSCTRARTAGSAAPATRARWPATDRRSGSRTGVSSHRCCPRGSGTGTAGTCGSTRATDRSPASPAGSTSTSCGNSLGPITIRRLSPRGGGRRGHDRQRARRPRMQLHLREERRPGHHGHAHRSARRRRLLHGAGRRLLGDRRDLHDHDARQPVGACHLRHRHHRARRRRRGGRRVPRAGRRGVRRTGPPRGRGERLLQRAGDDRVTVTRRCLGRRRDGRLRRPAAFRDAHAAVVPGRDYEVLVDSPGADPVVDRVDAAAALVHPFEAARSVEEGQAPWRSPPPGPGDAPRRARRRAARSR